MLSFHRHALRGGRVETVSLFYNYKSQPDKALSYVDNNSLYPHVNDNFVYIYYIIINIYIHLQIAIKYPFPIGEPEHILHPDRLKTVKIVKGEMFFEDKRIEGLIYCKVLPSTRAIPFLMTRKEGKSYSVCCNACLQENNIDICTHTEEERSIIDCFTCNEISFAVEECDYKLLEVYELLAYFIFEKIFAKFMTFFASQKIRYSGLPQNVKTENEVEDYCAKINDKMGFNHKYTKITPDSIKTNIIRRNLVKEALNSILGKMSQDSHVSSNLILASEDELQRIIQNPTYNVEYIQSVGEKLVHIQVKRNDGFEKINRKACLPIGTQLNLLMSIN